MTIESKPERSGTQGLWLVNITLLVMLAIAVYASMGLVKWAWGERQAKNSVTQTADVTTAMRERQLACLAKNIYYEAGGEPFEGKVAVAQVTLNRAENIGFPGDICQVIYQKNKFYDQVLCQFSWTCQSANSLKPMNKAEFHESTVVAKKVLLEGFRLPSLENALYFHADYIKPGWQRERVAKIGRHIFYK